MKTKLIYTWIGACVLAAGLLPGCTSDILPEEIPSAGTLTLTATDYYTAHWSEGGSRSLEPLSDELQKQIHNLYYFFYDKDGYIEYIYYQDVEPAAMTVEVNMDAFKVNGQQILTNDGMLYVVVNSQKMNYTGAVGGASNKPLLVSSEDVTVGDAYAWRVRVPTVHDFQKQGLFPLYLQMDGQTNIEGSQGGDWSVGRPDHFIMYGMFDGTLENHGDFEVLLGRIAVRMRLAISGDGFGQQAKITVENAPKYTSLFPNVTPLPSPESEGGLTYWTTFEELIDDGDAADNGDPHGNNPNGTDGKYGGIVKTTANGVTSYSSSMFYYCGENYLPEENERTKVRIEVWDAYDANRTLENASNPARVYELELGNEGPMTEDSEVNANRNYSLLRNTSYTFNLNLHSTRSTAAETRSTDGGIHLYPVEE